jgi:hypothetical protein
MDSMESLVEQGDRLRSVFGEKSFMLMRKMRYGIGGCWGCSDVGEDLEVLAAQMDVLDWSAAISRQSPGDES